MRQRSLARIALLPLLACVALANTAAAQAVRGTLLGTIQDAQGAPVPGVTVTATETQTNVSRSVVTNQSGNYVFANLKDGLYRVETALSGFKRFSRDGSSAGPPRTRGVALERRHGETFGVVQEAAPAGGPCRHGSRSRAGRSRSSPWARAATSRGCGPPCRGP